MRREDDVARAIAAGCDLFLGHAAQNNDRIIRKTAMSNEVPWRVHGAQTFMISLYDTAQLLDATIVKCCVNADKGKTEATRQVRLEKVADQP